MDRIMKNEMEKRVPILSRSKAAKMLNGIAAVDPTIGIMLYCRFVSWNLAMTCT